jgi:hypothetical protein
LSISYEQERWYRDQLERAKEKIHSHKDFPEELRWELDALELELVEFGFEPDFTAEILRQITGSLSSWDGNKRLSLRFARSIIKKVKTGDQMEMLLVMQMICDHIAKMNLTARMNATKEVDHCASYGNLSNKFSRTFVDQLGALQRIRSGPQRNLTVHNVSVSDGGQAAFVNHVTHNSADKGQPATTEAQNLLADHSGTAMPALDRTEETVTTVPAVEQIQEPAPIATSRRRRK